MEFKSNDDMFEYLQNRYEDNILMIILDFESYYEVNYNNNYVFQADKDLYVKNKLLDITGELENYGKQLFELSKPQLNKNIFNSVWNNISEKSTFSYEDAFDIFVQIKSCCFLNGCTAEVGVFEGYTSKMIIDTFKNTKKHYCYDLFEESKDKVFSCHLEEVEKNINSVKVIYKKGFFPYTFDENLESFCFVFSDTSTNIGAKNTYEFFKDNIVSGGKIVFYGDKYIDFTPDISFDVLNVNNLVIYTKK